MKATEGPKDDKLVEVSQENCKAVMNFDGKFVFSVWLGLLVNLVIVYTSGSLEDKSIICHRKAITVKDVQAQAWSYFSD